MAEASQQVNLAANGQAGNPAAANGNGSPQGSEPAWITHVPENLREDARKSYMLEADYRKKTSELSEQRKSWEEKEKSWSEKEQQWQKFNEQYQPFRSQLEKNWDKIAPILQGAAQQHAAQPTQATTDLFENFDLLPAQEQAKRLAEYTKTQLSGEYDQRLTAREKAINDKMEAYAAAIRNFLAVQTDAYNRKFQNPELDIDAYLKKALEFQNGGFNPMDAAYNALTAEQTMKRQQEEWMKKGREEAMLELQNKGVGPGAMQHSIIPSFTTKPLTRQQVAESVRNEVLKAGRSW